MVKKSICGIRIPAETFKQTEDIKDKTHIKNRIDAFRFMTNMQPEIINENTIKLPKSKSIIKLIDVRYVFKLK